MSPEGTATPSIGSALAVPDVGLEHYNRAVKVPVQKKPCPDETHSQQDMQEFKDVLSKVGLELDAEEWSCDSTHQTKHSSVIGEHMKKLDEDCQWKEWDWDRVEPDHNPKSQLHLQSSKPLQQRMANGAKRCSKSSQPIASLFCVGSNSAGTPMSRSCIWPTNQVIGMPSSDTIFTSRIRTDSSGKRGHVH